ncbi:MAG: DUF5677 domain-containing protein, partial [Mycobacterium sp.]
LEPTAGRQIDRDDWQDVILMSRSLTAAESSCVAAIAAVRRASRPRGSRQTSGPLLATERAHPAVVAALHDDDQVTPDDEDFGPILDELLDLYPTMPTLRLRKSHRRASHLAHGWYQRVRRSSEAVIGLNNLGYGPEAAPIRRTIIEHVVVLKWLADEGDKVLDTPWRWNTRTAPSA